MEQIVFLFPREDPDAFIWVILLGNFGNQMCLCVRHVQYVQKKEEDEVQRITKKGNEKGEMKAEN